MRSDWILDVLADLRTFALSNDLPALAEQLDDTALVAMAEISALEEKGAGSAGGGVQQTIGPNIGRLGAG